MGIENLLARAPQGVQPAQQFAQGRALDLGLQGARGQLQDATTARQSQSRLQDLLAGGASPEQLAGSGFVDQAGQLLKMRSTLDKTKQSEFDRGIRTLDAFTQGIPEGDPRFEQQVLAARQSLPDVIDDEDVKQALQLGSGVISRLAKGTGKINLSQVQSSKILPGGLTQITTKDGKTEVLRLNEKDAAAVRAAEERGASLQGLRSQERETGKGAAKIALESFDRAGKIRENVSDLQEGIRLVREEGANTGVVVSKLPSVRAASVKLDQLQKKLGLNVVGAVTFGALSKGELDLAKDVALPKNLSEDEIVDWMERKIAAQTKMASNLEDAALFLAEPGNTVVGFIKLQRKQREADQSQQAPQTDQQGAINLQTTKPQDVDIMTPQQKDILDKQLKDAGF